MPVLYSTSGVRALKELESADPNYRKSPAVLSFLDPVVHSCTLEVPVSDTITASPVSDFQL